MNEALTMVRKLTTEEWIEKAIAKHGDKYDYSMAIYTKAHERVKIACSVGHVFFQKAYSHLNGKGCNECGGSRRSNTQEFIEKAKAKHGDKFDYSMVEYVRDGSKVKIICKKAGHVFLQTPNDHKQGLGCNECLYLSRRGETHPNWNPDLTDEVRRSKRQLHLSEQKEWRTSVYDKDGFACQKCHDDKGGNLNAHHILPWSKFPEVRFDVDNGITFCRTCHHKYHSAYKLAECNHKTIAEFLATN